MIEEICRSSADKDIKSHVIIPIIFLGKSVHARYDNSSIENINLRSDTQLIILVIIDRNVAGVQRIYHVIALPCILA